MHPPVPPLTWNFDPAVLLAMALLLGGYLYIVGPLRARLAPDDETPMRCRVYFVAGWAVLLLTLISPLDTYGRYYMFAAHTTQLFLIITLATPLLLLGVPEWLTWTLLPTRAIRNATRGLMFPISATLLFNGIILVWHVGPIFEASLHNETLHDLASLSFVVAGLLTWWPLLTPLDTQQRLHHPVQMLYLVFESLPLDIFGVFTMFAVRIFYPTYALAPHLFGLSAVEDQAAGGAILAVPGNIIDIILMSMVFFVWIQRMERAQQEKEREMYAEEDAASLRIAPATSEDN